MCGHRMYGYTYDCTVVEKPLNPSLVNFAVESYRHIGEVRKGPLFATSACTCVIQLYFHGI